MIWLDGLDLPLYQAFPTNFAETYSEERYPSEYVRLRHPHSLLLLRLSALVVPLIFETNASPALSRSLFHQTIIGRQRPAHRMGASAAAP